MKNNRYITFQPALASALFSMFCVSAYAVSDFSLVGGIGLEAHDNAGLVHTDEESDTKRIISADIGYKKNDGALNADINYILDYADYVRDVQGDETAVNGRSTLTWQIAPRQFDAVLYHQITQQLTDRRGLNVESNREQRSVVTAGFNGYLHLSQVDSLVLAPRFTEVHYQESDNSDSKRSALAATWDHKLSKVSALDVQATYDDVKFDDGENDYRSPGVMVSLNTTLSRLSYQLGVGGSRINRDNGKDFSGSKVIAALDYKSDEGQEWGASYIRQLTDTSIGLSGAELQLTHFQSNDSNAVVFDIVQQDKLDIYWRSHLSTSAQLLLGAGYQKENYKETPQDQSITYAQLGYNYAINTRWSALLDTRFDRTKFLDDPTTKYDTIRVYLSAIYRPTRPLEIRLSVGQDKRKADNDQASYTDNVILAGLRYRFF